MKVLIVEDNMLFRETMKDALTSSFPSMEIEESEDGEQILERTGIFFPDIIFMDIQLPQHNGLVLTEKIKSLYPHITIIIITAYDNQDYREAAFRAGADFFLSKTGLKTRDIVGAVELLFHDHADHTAEE